MYNIGEGSRKASMHTSHTDMAAATICESHFGKDAKRARHLREEPFPFVFFVGGSWDVVQPIYFTIVTCFGVQSRSV